MMNAAANVADNILGKVPTSTPAIPLFDESRTMHALAWHGKKSVKYVEKPVPKISDPRDIVLKITATTICGSDLHLYSGNMMNMKDGDILGHEFMGIIEDVGAAVKKFQVGQRVVVAFDIACGTCDYCKRQEYTGCDTTNPSRVMESLYGHRTAALYGYSHMTGGVPGGQAEYVRVPFADVNCLLIPPGLPDEKVLYLSDVVPTALHAVEMGEVKKGSTVGIWGLGPIGLMAAKWAQIKGASRVIGIDCIPERLALAKNYLKIETINYKEEDTLKALERMIPGGLDCGIEAAGFEYAKTMLHKVERAVGLETDTADILSEIITAVRKFGVVSIIGVYSGTANHFPIGAMMEKGLTVRGGQSPTQKYWDYCLDLIKKGEIDPTFMISHKATLAAGPELYEQFYNRTDGVIKVFLRPSGSPAQ